MSDVEKRKRGRPKTGGDIRKRQYRIVMTDDEFDRFGRLSRVSGKSKADFLRDAMEVAMKRVEDEMAAKFAHLNRGDDEDYGYFEEYEEEFDDDFG